RTLKAEVLGQSNFTNLEHAQKAFDRWRPVYNHERPHQALDMEVPASRYSISPRAFPEVLTPIEYGPDDLVRKVQGKGEISFHSRVFTIGMAFKGLPVALRPTTHDGVYDVFFLTNHICNVDLNNPNV
ncbi:MAG: transposase, partial [Chloroflexi bacterium]|nr:transposase [Chloroflexota bacterium]